VALGLHPRCGRHRRGPSSWGDYFSQQLRWSRGTFELLIGPFWHRFRRLGAGRMLHYLLIVAFYPSMALGWMLGAVNATLYLALGVSGLVVPPELWFALYVDATLFQLCVYVRNRRYNVSPFEEEGSPGLRGMLMSVLCAPMYASALMATLLRRPAKFVVTPKNSASSSDRLLTFRRHLQWAALLSGAIGAAVAQGYANVDVIMWPALAVLVSLAPVIVWLLMPRPRAVAKVAVPSAAPRESVAARPAPHRRAAAPMAVPPVPRQRGASPVPAPRPVPRHAAVADPPTHPLSRLPRGAVPAPREPREAAAVVA
jgi:hypothetical protein